MNLEGGEGGGGGGADAEGADEDSDEDEPTQEPPEDLGDEYLELDSWMQGDVIMAMRSRYTCPVPRADQLSRACKLSPLIGH